MRSGLRQGLDKIRINNRTNAAIIPPPPVDPFAAQVSLLVNGQGVYDLKNNVSTIVGLLRQTNGFYVFSVNNYLNIDHNSTLNLTGNFTLEILASSSSIPSTGLSLYFLTKAGGGTLANFEYQLYLNDLKLTFDWTENGVNYNSVFVPCNPPLNADNYYKIYRSGNTLYFYLNGSLLGTAAMSISPQVAGNPFRIGWGFASMTGNFNLKALRITKEARMSNEIPVLNSSSFSWL